MVKGSKRVPETKIIKCRDCGKELELPRSSKKYLCDDCKLKSFSNHFSARKEQKILCSNPFCDNVVRTEIRKTSTASETKRGDVLCSSCKEIKKIKDREVRCTKCGELRYIEYLNDVYQLKPIVYSGLCDKCKELKEDNKKSKLPVKDKISQKIVCSDCGELIEEKPLGYYLKEIKYSRCQKCKEIKDKINRENASKRMKDTNPMYDKDIRWKVRNTIKTKIKNNELTYKNGKEHHLFKGLRAFNQDVRSHLYNIWIRPVLERDGFKCTSCGCTSNLQVHHIKPLREICEETFDELNINVENTLFTRKDIGDELYEKALTRVIEKHKIDYGITLCKDCHEKEDYFYRPYKGEHKNEN